MAVTIQTRRDSAADWTTANPVLALGEIGIEVDTDNAKYGDGVTPWNSLSYWLEPAGIPQPGSVDGGVLRWESIPGEWQASNAIIIDDAARVGVGGAAVNRIFEITDSVPALRMNDTDMAGLFSEIIMASGRTSFRADQGNVEAGHYMDFFVGGTERMRIDSAGNLLVAKTSTAASVAGCEFSVNGAVIAAQNNISIFNRVAHGGDAVIQFRLSNTQAGGINANTAGLPIFTAPSDVRLKDNIQDAPDRLAEVMALRPVTYTMKSTGEAGEGFIADEVEQVWPDYVERGDDGYKVLRGLDTTHSRFIKAMQQQQAIIDDLTARLKALENSN